MSKIDEKFSSKSEIDDGISLISTTDWVVLSCFFKSSITNSPDSEAKMRSGLQMLPGDAFAPAFADTVALYKDLVALSNDFTFRIADEVLNLADDIVHYQAKADVVYTRLADLVGRFDMPGVGDTPEALQEKFNALIKLWKGGQVSGNSDQIQKRFKLALEDLILEAEKRATRAEKLREDILGPLGLKMKLQASKTGFDSKKEVFESEFGKESPRVVKFKIDVENLQIEISGLRKKERDEVIALGTSPLYLIIPFFGPFILLGVNIGVGVDLAVTRAKIDAKLNEAGLISTELGRAERFMTYYNNGKSMVTKTSKGIENILPKIETLGLGWRAIAKDIRFIVDLLSGPGRSQSNDEDWFNFVTTLKTAQKSWASVATKAEHLRTVAMPVAANDLDEAMKKLAA
ncbi:MULTISPECIES: hypothetical protein [unclassified Variovorax]|uniref:hypothetical protein n=1 Tax=unclassified Variovorax TaxID=663243 RepID=UPI001BD6312D|nr:MULTISPECIES: hypothetical protein [unclassified Variovorax]